MRKTSELSMAKGLPQTLNNDYTLAKANSPKFFSMLMINPFRSFVPMMLADT